MTQIKDPEIKVTAEQVQMAHDTFGAVLEGELKDVVKLTPEARKQIHTLQGALCWFLGHETAIWERVQEICAYAEQQGFEFGDSRHPNPPQA